MRILIYTTHRTGSTSLGELLMTHYRCQYMREGFFYHENFTKRIGTVDNIVMKLTPELVEYNSIRGLFDKCIVLTRENVVDQAESRVYAEHIKEWFIPYKVEKDFFETHKTEMDRMVSVIESENKILSECMDCLHITYE